ncbi:hypothetical protein BDZ94DRAFT_1248577 [Collybia nuda]|uniref:F-box domain-containing protein n=1 Tax=Collybia nuda TaxID=64659 RepID=A0A9P5YFA9_9AGAR|nr:hypothetical protein BDZ94DRAFT_1248577 [Collybia nuda]
MGSCDLAIDSMIEDFSKLALDDFKIIPPMLRLPSDILYQLFLSSAPSDPIENVLETVRLSHVCSGWRSIILQAPLLWTYVNMYMTSSGVEHSAVMTSFFRRSKNLPLTFHLFADIDVDRRRREELGRIISPHTSRFRALYIMVDPLVSLQSPLDAIISFPMPLLCHFDLAVQNQQRCTVFMEPRPQSSNAYFIVPDSPTPYLDWTVRGYNLTTLSLKYLDLLPADLLPILMMTQKSLIHLELYNDYMVGVPARLPYITLPNLISFRVGYRRPAVVAHLVKLLILPKLASLTVHDFGSCPDSTTPRRMQDTFFKVVPNKDATELLTAMCPFGSVGNLKLLGVTCPSTPLPGLLQPLQYLFQAVKSLSLVLCDADFLDALVEATVVASPTLLENLSELTITSEDYPLVLNYLSLRASRGLPRLKLLSVNPRMAVLRHFYADYAEGLRVVGRRKQRVNKDI